MTLLLILALVVIVVPAAMVLIDLPILRDRATTPDASDETVDRGPNLPALLRRPLRSRYVD